MKKRAMKKWIPKNTMYCYKILHFNNDSSHNNEELLKDNGLKVGENE